jgi:hypothetical protein
MAKFFGPIGYAIRVETRPGVWRDSIEEHDSYGDVDRAYSNWTTSSDSTNDDLNMNVQISIVADQFVNDNLRSMKYVRYMGANWKITKIEPRRPRLILTIGGVYNGPIAQS